MERKKWKDVLASAVANGGVFALSASMLLMYGQSKYRLFLLSGIFLLMLAAINLILVAFGNAEKKSDENPSCEGEKKKGFVLRALTAVGRKCRELYWKARGVIVSILLFAALVACLIWFGGVLWSTSAAFTLQYWQLAVIGILFVVAVVADNLCRHSGAERPRYAMLLRNACVFFKLSKVILALVALSMTLSMLNIFDLSTYVAYALGILFYYVGAMTAISLGVRIFRGELFTLPGIVILLPFMGGDAKELSVVSFLEDNTGITLRSLWSIKFVKSIVPYTVVFAALLFWISTGVVMVQSHQEAAVFRLGVLQEETLKPGIHINLPYPLDKTEIYDAKTVNKMTIGYKSSENIDNVWTENHGDSEYRLLLGSGKELVSINIRLEYRISDLKKYLRASASPEKILEARAYELVTERTISTDLDTILSTNRASFSETFFEDLSAEMSQNDVGLEVVSVILESIHPPVEVADIYQRFIAAEVDAQRYILEAEGEAAQIRAAADVAAHQLKVYAEKDQAIAISQATTEIAEFMSAVNAAEQYPDEYKYYKYLDAICRAYKNAQLIIVSDDVDSDRLHFVGNIYVKN